jgi:hypothetical protein
MDSPIIRHAKISFVNKSLTEGPAPPKAKVHAKKARKAGYKAKAYLSEVARHPEDFDPQTATQARFMRNILQKD